MKKVLLPRGLDVCGFELKIIKIGSGYMCMCMRSSYLVHKSYHFTFQMSRLINLLILNSIIT